MSFGLLALLTLLGCGPEGVGPWRQAPQAPPQAASPGLLVLTLEEAPATRFGPWGGADDRLDAFASMGTTWTRAYAPTPLRQPNLATLWMGAGPEVHGLWLDGMQRLPEHHTLLFEELADAGWHTASSTGTLLTDDRWGLHQGARSRSVHDDPEPRGLFADAVVDRLEVRAEPQAAWVHLPADGLGAVEPLVSRWVETHPEGWVVVAGIHGRGSGLTLDDDALHMPLIVVGPGFDGGVRIDDVVSLADVAPTLRGLVGLETSQPTLQEGGADVVDHATHLGRALFGAGVIRATTDPDGRVVVGTEARWYGRKGTEIRTDGHIVPEYHDAVQGHATRRAEQPTQRAPVALQPLAERGRLAQVAPHTLGDPDAIAGKRDPSPGQGTFVEAIAKPLRWKQYRELHRIAASLDQTPFGRLVEALASRGQADAVGAAAALEAGHGSSGGPLFAWHRAEVALDRCQVDVAAEWLDIAMAFDPIVPTPTATALHRARALGPLPEGLAAHEARLVADWPQDPYVAPLTDPLATTHLPVRPGSAVTGLVRARAQWAQGHATEAIESLRAAVATDPMDCTLRVELARWLMEAEDHLAAQRLLAPLVRARPDDPALQALWEQVQVQPEERYRRQLDRTYNRP